MHRTNRLLALVSIALLMTAVACAPAGTARTARSDPDRIGRAEIVATSAASAYDVVSQLHPDWLRPSRPAMGGAMGATQTGSKVRTPLVLVYLDGVRYGGIDQLRSLPTSALTSIEFASGNRVAMVVRDLGNPAPDAVILVSTKQ